MAGVHIRCIPAFECGPGRGEGQEEGVMGKVMKKRMEEMEPFAYAVTITRKRGLRAIYLRISRTGRVLVSAHRPWL